MRKLFNDEAGFIISAELVLVLTIGVLGMIVGLASLRDSIDSELVDLSDAFGAISQSFNYKSIFKSLTLDNGEHARSSGSGFNDKSDECDCSPLQVEIVGGKDDANSTGTVNEGN